MFPVYENLKINADQLNLVTLKIFITLLVDCFRKAKSSSVFLFLLKMMTTTTNHTQTPRHHPPAGMV